MRSASATLRVGDAAPEFTLPSNRGDRQSLSEYLRTMLGQSAARPTTDELTRRITARGAARLPESSERLVRRLRDDGE